MAGSKMATGSSTDISIWVWLTHVFLPQWKTYLCSWLTGSFISLFSFSALALSPPWTDCTSVLVDPGLILIGCDWLKKAAPQIIQDRLFDWPVHLIFHVGCSWKVIHKKSDQPDIVDNCYNQNRICITQSTLILHQLQGLPSFKRCSDL